MLDRAPQCRFRVGIGDAMGAFKSLLRRGPHGSAATLTRSNTDTTDQRHQEEPVLRRPTRLMLAAPILGLLLLGFASSAVANSPSRQPWPPPTGTKFIFTDTKGNNPCGFPVDLLVLNNREVGTIFVHNGVTLVAGTLTVRLTNTINKTFVDLNISGPTHLTSKPDGSTTQIALGPQLWVFDPGVAPGLPRLALINGRTVSMFDPAGNFSWISTTGSVQNLCIPLASE